MTYRIFIIDDDPDIVTAAEDMLHDEGYLTSSSYDPREAMKKIRENPPDLVLLDVRLPDMDGYELCRMIKNDPKIQNLPIIMISVKKQGSDVAIGLEMGAVDYIRKPFDERELIARVKNALKRSQQEKDSGKITAGPIEVDYERYEAHLDGRPLKLTPKQFELLGYFLKNEGRVLTRPKMSENIWGMDYNPTSKTIEFHVEHLRKKLGAYGHFIKALKGVGYRFEVPD